MGREWLIKHTTFDTNGTKPVPPDFPYVTGGPRFVAANATDGTKPVPPDFPYVTGRPRFVAANATDGTKPVPPDFHFRHRPSRNSVKTGRDNRSTILFVTVNADKRQRVFDNADAHKCIVLAWREARNWLVGKYVIMPDHLHFCCAPGMVPPPDFHRWMKYWKARVALSFPVAHGHPLWQRQCWDTQLRNGENFAEKWEYIRNNPVRAGLVANADDWPYQGVLNELQWHDR